MDRLSLKTGKPVAQSRKLSGIVFYDVNYKAKGKFEKSIK